MEIPAAFLEHNTVINFSEFMQQALYSPDFGYYTGKNTQVGETGDFTTAPEISPLFSFTLAKQIIMLLEKLEYNPVIVEYGAGNGTMAHDIIQYINSQGISVEYQIIEISPHLKKKQQKKLKNISSKNNITWHQTLAKNTCGIIIANELLDAMPTELIKIKNGTPYIMQVTLDSSKNFIWKEQQLSSHNNPDLFACYTNIVQENTHLQHESEYTLEINLNHKLWLEDIDANLKQGALMIIDYGYDQRELFHPQRRTGTLKCFFQHQSHNNPLINVGKQDITSHINFSFLADIATTHNFDISGYTTQASCLISLGITDLLEKQNFNDSEYLKASASLKTLTSPFEMGDIVKVLGLTKDMENHTWDAFKIFNYRHKL